MATYFPSLGDIQGQAPNFTLSDSGATSGTYGDASNTAQITVDSSGRITDVQNVEIGLTIQDEGSPLSTVASALNFTGSGVTASGTGATKTITIPGIDTIVMDDGTVTGERYPSDPSAEGVWYGTNTKSNVVSSSVTIGNNAASGTRTWCVTIGNSATSTNNENVSVGRNAAAGGAAIAIGDQSSAALQASAVGGRALATGGGGSTAVGYQARGTSSNTVALGRDAFATGSGATSIGWVSRGSQTNTCALGRQANASATSAIAIGANTFSDIANGIAIGAGANTLNTSYPIAIVTNASGVNATAPTGAVTYLGVTINGVQYKILLQAP